MTLAKLGKVATKGMVLVLGRQASAARQCLNDGLKLVQVCTRFAQPTKIAAIALGGNDGEAGTGAR